MADNTEEENLDNPTNIQPENSPDQITPTADAETINPNQETENMEVHHHAHREGKKNWKSYFWEFLMLFLAVFCGFLAEYQLEHVIEHQREKQYMQSLIADLKNDQEVLFQHIVHVKSGISMMDSMVNILNSPSQITDNTGKLYFLQDLHQG